MLRSHSHSPKPKEEDSYTSKIQFKNERATIDVSNVRFVRRWSRSDFGYHSNSDSSDSSCGTSSIGDADMVPRKINPFRNPEDLVYCKRFIPSSELLEFSETIQYVISIDFDYETMSNISFEDCRSDTCTESENPDDGESMMPLL